MAPGRDLRRNLLLPGSQDAGGSRGYPQKPGGVFLCRRTGGNSPEGVQGKAGARNRVHLAQPLRGAPDDGGEGTGTNRALKAPRVRRVYLLAGGGRKCDGIHTPRRRGVPCQSRRRRAETYRLPPVHPHAVRRSGTGSPGALRHIGPAVPPLPPPGNPPGIHRVHEQGRACGSLEKRERGDHRVGVPGVQRGRKSASQSRVSKRTKNHSRGYCPVHRYLHPSMDCKKARRKLVRGSLD